jgi:acetylglutamate kinase
MTDNLNGIMVVKIGGVALGSQDTTLADIVELQRRGVPLVIVHGGGNVITSWLERQQIPVRFVRGERVTDAAALEIVTAVLKGVINARITSAVNALGGRAVGITGIDGAILKATVRDDDMGYVGRIIEVDTTLLKTLLAGGLVPVMAPLGQRIFDGEPAAPHHLNINGDIAAGEIAAAIGPARLVFLTDVAGIMDGDGRVIGSLSAAGAGELVSRGQATGGMIPKVNAALRALSAGVTARIIDGTAPHALLGEIENGGGGTTIQ